MTTPIRPRDLLLTAGMTLLLAACGSGSAPATTVGTAAAPTLAAGATAGPTGAAAAPTVAAPATTAVAAAPTVASATTGASTGKACTIVTQADVATAAGFSIATVNGIDTICYFQNADQSKYLVIQLFTSQADMAPVLQLESGSDHIAGLGDDAFWVPVAGILFVRQGDHGMQISDSEGALTAATNTSLQAALITLARTALPSL